MCLQCLDLQIDIKSEIETKVDLIQCKKCSRWHIRQNQWAPHDMESAGLLAHCLRQVGGLSKTKLLDAIWIWTEPHSKRLKIAVDVEHGVLDGKMNIKKRVVIEFVINNKQCMDCIREATDHTWVSLLQVRQRTGHKRSMYLLETLLTKASLHETMSGVEVVKDGIDFYFKAKNSCERVIDFIQSNLPTKTRHSKKLVSADNHSNTQKYEYTSIMEVAPVCKGDLVYLPTTKKLWVVSKLSSSMHLLDPKSLARKEITADKYFAAPFTVVLTFKHLVPFVVLDIEPVVRQQGVGSVFDSIEHSLVKEQGGLLAEAEIIRESDFGVSDDAAFRVSTHLGHVLKAGDTVLGYDVLHAVLDDDTIGDVDGLPDAVLIQKKKGEEEGRRRPKKRSDMLTFSVTEEDEEGPELESVEEDDSVEGDVEDAQQKVELLVLDDDSA